jgi:hypothetical protein
MTEHRFNGLSLKELIRKEPSLGDIFVEISGAASPPDDRSFAIIECSNLENKLDLLIKNNLDHFTNKQKEDLFEAKGAPLQSFSGKIQVAFAMKLIGLNTYKDMMALKNVRNVFAHAKISVDFHVPAIIKECEKMRGYDGGDLPDWAVKGGGVYTSKARTKFGSTCYLLKNAIALSLFPDGLFSIDGKKRPQLPLD